MKIETQIPRRLIIILLALVLLIEMSILIGLKDFGYAGTDKGLLPHDFGVRIISIIITLAFIVINIIFSKKSQEKSTLFQSIIILLVAVIVWCINLFLFFGPLYHIKSGDFDNDGLPNFYERIVDTNLYIKNKDPHTYIIQKSYDEYKYIKNITLRITGKGNNYNVLLKKPTYFEYPNVSDSDNFQIVNYNSNIVAKDKDYINNIEVEIELYNSYKSEDFSVKLADDYKDFEIDNKELSTKNKNNRITVNVPVYLLRDNNKIQIDIINKNKLLEKDN